MAEEDNRNISEGGLEVELNLERSYEINLGLNDPAKRVHFGTQLLYGKRNYHEGRRFNMLNENKESHGVGFDVYSKSPIVTGIACGFVKDCDTFCGDGYNLIGRNKKEMRGADTSLLYNLSEKVVGIQTGVFFAAAGEVEGSQRSLFLSYTAGKVNGEQFGGVLAVADEVEGVQRSLVASRVEKKLNGSQKALLCMGPAEGDYTQLGLICVQSGSKKGWVKRMLPWGGSYSLLFGWHRGESPYQDAIDRARGRSRNVEALVEAPAEGCVGSPVEVACVEENDGENPHGLPAPKPVPMRKKD